MNQPEKSKFASDIPKGLMQPYEDWKVLLVEDDEAVHTKAYELLKPFVHQGRGIRLISATSIEIAEVLIEQNADLAVLLIGHLETVEQSLSLIPYLREKQSNHWTRVLYSAGTAATVEEAGLLTKIQGCMNHGLLKTPDLRKYLLNTLKTLEEAVYSTSLHILDSSQARGATTIFRWKNEPTWPVEFVSLNVKELTGYTDRELTSGEVPYANVIFPADLERVAAEVAEYTNSGKDHYTQEYRLIHKDGRVIWIYDVTNIIRGESGDATHYLGYVYDITQKKEQEKLLFDREIFGVIKLDLHENILEVNQTAADIFRSTGAKITGSYFYDWVDPEQVAKAVEGVNGVRVTKHPQRLEVKLQGTTEGLVSCQLTISYIDEVGASQGGFLVILEDLTEKKKVEDELRQALANEKSFIASVSHEIRTPLSSILGYTELLQSSPELKDEQRHFAESISVNSQHLLNLINDILDISKLESNQLSLNVKEVVLSDLFTDCGVVVSSNVKEGVRLKVNVPDFNYYVKCDPIRIKQIFINLLSNAAKFTEHGSISLYIKDFTPLEGDALSLRICVEDSGIGIGKEKQKELFKPFKQAHIGDYGGTGLGLYLSRSIVKLMDGDIYVESDLGKGSKFIVELVLAKGRLKEAEFQFKDKGILVIGDYPSLNEDQKIKLQNAGARLSFIDALAPGKEIYQEILALEGVDLAILDVDLLKERSLALSAMLKDCHPGIGIVGLKIKTNSLQNTLVEHNLLKPFSHFQLAKILQKALATGQRAKVDDFSHLRVLMVEDVQANRQLFTQMLKKFFNLELQTAADGAEGVKKVKKETFDLVLMDLQMPGMDGVQAATEIRKFDSTTPIVAITGSVYAEDVQRAKSAGMNSYLAKPVQKDDLKKLFVELLEGKPMSAQEADAPHSLAKKVDGEPALVLESLGLSAAIEQPLITKMKEFLETIGSPEEVQEEILRSAILEIKEGYIGVQESYQAGNKKSLMRYLHKLKGLLANLNLTPQGEAAQDLDSMIRQNKDDKVFRKTMENFITDLREFA
ncbi:MAG: response regulator [SAR324 cluster bacterium]|nr:response regulator [SAR324 cluster bacterium]